MIIITIIISFNYIFLTFLSRLFLVTKLTYIIFSFIHDSGCSNRICQGKKKEISPTTASNYVEVDQTFENLEREPQQNLSLKNFEFALKLALFTYSLFPFVDFSSLIYKFSKWCI